MSNAEPDIPALAAAIGEAAALAGWRGAGIENVNRLSGGASKESWAFDLVGANGMKLAMVLRRQPAKLRFTFTGVESLGDEAALLRAAGQAGVPVPAVHFELPEGSAAGEGYAMARIEGETVGVRILKSPDLAEVRPRLARQCGEVLARLHAVPLSGLPRLVSRSPAEELAALHERHRATGQDRPVFDYAFRWLAENLPADGDRTLVHGDFRNGNLIIGPDGIRAVLDWEFARIGSAVSDLAWMCVTSWRFQNPHLPVGGFGTREEMLAGYIAAGGQPVDPAHLHAWEVFLTMSWGVMCAEVVTTFAQGARNVEAAMIARRSSETEFDLLRLLLANHEAWTKESGHAR